MYLGDFKNKKMFSFRKNEVKVQKGLSRKTLTFGNSLLQVISYCSFYRFKQVK
jgi:hypothetical protein